MSRRSRARSRTASQGPSKLRAKLHWAEWKRPSPRRLLAVLPRSCPAAVVLVLLSAPKAGGATTTLAIGGYPYELALDDTYVYWSDNDGPIWKVAKTGGSPIKLADQTTVNSFQPMGIAGDGTNVYFETSDGKICQG